MAIHRIFVDADRGLPVVSADDSSVATLPALVQGDTLTLRITLLTGFSRIASYQQIPVAGITLQVALGTKLGSVSLLYANQFTWTASDDLADAYFQADLSLNTTEVDDLIGATAGAQAWFEIKSLDGGLPRTVLSKLVNVSAAVIKDDALLAAALPTPISAEACQALFLQRIIPASAGNPLILQNGSVTYALYPHTDGTFQTIRLT